jgi:hypothetical protein
LEVDAGRTKGHRGMSSEPYDPESGHCPSCTAPIVLPSFRYCAWCGFYLLESVVDGFEPERWRRRRNETPPDLEDEHLRIVLLRGEDPAYWQPPEELGGIATNRVDKMDQGTDSPPLIDDRPRVFGSPICDNCKHEMEYGYRRCDAFPEPGGIPEEIWKGDNGHTEPYQGDHGIRFEPRGSPLSKKFGGRLDDGERLTEKDIERALSAGDGLVKKCPRCGSQAVIPIVYGLPAPELVRKAEAGEVVLGGCEYDPSYPIYACRDCGEQWNQPRASGQRKTREAPKVGNAPLIDFNAGYYMYPVSICRGYWAKYPIVEGLNHEEISSRDKWISDVLFRRNTEWFDWISKKYMEPDYSDVLRILIRDHGIFLEEFFQQETRPSVTERFTEHPLTLSTAIHNY